jgi:iron complex transport system ATP-binding protein
VLGGNGAGKSTLLKCLNGILKPPRGSVRVDGEELLQMSRASAARRLGYVPQRYSETQQTVFELVLMGRRPHIRWALSAADYERVEEVIEQMGIAHLAARSASDLSGGELQKAVIARALAQSPEVLLLDEPTSCLDLKGQVEVMSLIRRIVETENLSAIIAIHDLNLAVHYADQFVFLKDGRIHAAVSKKDLTAEIIGEVYGMNVVLKEFDERMVVMPV